MVVKCSKRRHRLQSQQCAKKFTVKHVSHDERFLNEFTMWNRSIHCGGPRNLPPSPLRLAAMSLGGGGRVPFVTPEQEEVRAPSPGMEGGKRVLLRTSVESAHPER
ncbi:hypothetical protein CDAR_21901 [Caerostris darwini]|uniref:Uncharacterized protein n=1 Tax=Caerostris darwini TaxID=1538125 RepID=A0AAV4VW36_9ARAC|nr:hypothetical protein CDAR_21901 [Caerostris darwini]